MKKSIWILILFFLLVACSTKATPTPTESVDNEPRATNTSEPIATETEVPPTSTPTDVPEPTDTPEATASADQLDPLVNYPEEGYGPNDFPENINPLTGLPVDDPTVLDRRPVAVKISNYPREIRPQWGLSVADLVFEYYHEGGLTRFHAIFYGTDAKEAGPIRSGRFADEHLVQAYKSVFAFGSADYRVRWKFNTSDFSNRLATVSDRPCPPDTTYPTCRTDPNQWNHLMTDTSILSQHFTNNGVSNGRQYLDGLRFNKTAPPEGETAETMIVRYSADDYHQWVYDANTQKYQRYHDLAFDSGQGETFDLLLDRLNNEVVDADNVVILFVPHSFFSREPEMILIDLIGYGDALVLRNGEAYKANWARTNTQEIVSITYEDGSRFPLKPGNTWFEIVGMSSPILAESPNWRVQFQTP